MKDTGYVLISDELMRDEALANILFDNFEIIKDISTFDDRLNGISRLEMTSELFMNGYCQYEILIGGNKDATVFLREVNPVMA